MKKLAQLSLPSSKIGGLILIVLEKKKCVLYASVFLSIWVLLLLFLRFSFLLVFWWVCEGWWCICVCVCMCFHHGTMFYSVVAKLGYMRKIPVKRRSSSFRFGLFPDDTFLCIGEWRRSMPKIFNSFLLLQCIWVFIFIQF